MISTLMGEYMCCIAAAFALTLIVVLLIAAERLIWFGISITRDLAVVGYGRFRNTLPSSKRIGLRSPKA
jgi:hypothetical protein